MSYTFILKFSKYTLEISNSRIISSKLPLAPFLFHIIFCWTYHLFSPQAAGRFSGCESSCEPPLGLAPDRCQLRLVWFVWLFSSVCLKSDSLNMNPLMNPHWGSYLQIDVNLKTWIVKNDLQIVSCELAIKIVTILHGYLRLWIVRLPNLIWWKILF